jgi:hypothetical protein
MALELSFGAVNNREAASIVSIFILLLTVAVAIVVRACGVHLGVRHEMTAGPVTGPGAGARASARDG